MNEVVICAAAAVTALGDTLEASWQGLLAGRNGIAEVQRFDTSAYTSSVAACVPGLEPGPEGSRLPALLDRLCDGFQTVPAEAQLWLATTKGAIDVLERRERGLPAQADRILAAGRHLADTVDAD